MLPVAAVTKHFPKNKMKSPTLLITATCTALEIIVLKACENFLKRLKIIFDPF